MIKMGMKIGDRYEIIEKIGTGGMSDVYKAKCHKLNRFVAIKVLKQEFSENTNFVSKFRVEAQAAAGLMHPNIVNVYDVGEENGIYYIVMELVDGITLKKYIERKARLSIKEAISIAIQVSMGIEAAHNNHIIHRDIKPQNIIISKEGKVKVTDFGIAKAATSNTITSNVMGSVHYTSPEQARGGYSDEKSDIYSLGITLFEMLTGRVPFNGETTVAIAIKHIQEEMPSPRDYVAEIPISVEQIVFKCTQKSPDRRYQSMKDLIADLKQSLMNPDEEFVKFIDLEKKEETKMISEGDMDLIKKQSASRDNWDGEVAKKRRIKQEIYPNKENAEEDYNPKKDKIITVAIICIATLIGLGILFFVGKAVGIFNSADEQVQQRTMIDIVGKQWTEAKKLLDDAEILYDDPTYKESDSVEAGAVISTSYVKGDIIVSADKVSVVVSAGAKGVSVPDVLGKTKGEAISILVDAGFQVEKVLDYSEAVTKDYIISQTPGANEKVAFGVTVIITVSLGKEETQVEIPNVLGKTEAEARSLLEAVGLLCETGTTMESTQYLDGQVCFQTPSAGGTVLTGSSVNIRISTGALYNCNISVTKPVEYVSGSASIVLTTEAGDMLYSTTTTVFPVAININGIHNSSKGVITIVYNINVSETTTDGDGNTVTQTTQVPQTETIPVTFTQ